MHTLTFASICSGIEAASAAWEPLGWRCLWLAEIDKAASAVLAHQFPDIPNLGDLVTLPDRMLAGEIEPPDVLIGGTPCQSFSIAGLRGGMADARGALTLAFVRLADAIDVRRRELGKPPVLIVWENVPGVFTHKDNPFGCFLGALAGDDVPLEPGERPDATKSTKYWTWNKKAGQHRPKWPNAGAADGPQRTIAWRVLDAQYFGLAQRRNRTFVVASADSRTDPGAILFECEGVRRDSPPSRTAGEGASAAIAPSLTGGGRGVARAGDPRGQDPMVAVPQWWDGHDIAQTLDAVLHKGQTMPEKDRFPAVLQPICPTLLAGSNQTGGDRPPSTDVDTADSLIVIPFDTTQISSPANYSRPQAGDPCHPLAAGAHPPAICFSSKDHGGDALEECAPPLEAAGHKDSHANAGAPPAVIYGFYPTNRQSENCCYANISPPIKVGSGNGGGIPPAVCVIGSVTHTLKADGFDGSEDGTGRGQPITVYSPEIAGTLKSCANSGTPNGAEEASRMVVCGISPGCLGRSQATVSHETGQGWWKTGNVSGTLRAEGENRPSRPSHVVADSFATRVRRLMPVECERLQGFPDHWTLTIARNGRPVIQADGPRYKQIGNSMPVPVIRWLGVRIQRELRPA